MSTSTALLIAYNVSGGSRNPTVMPKGVEHEYGAVARLAYSVDPIYSVMPKGVEHLESVYAFNKAMFSPIYSVMPKGVEHVTGSRTRRWPHTRYTP